MKILISVDMEGITGITSFEQVNPAEAEYSRARHWMTSDVNAAVAAAADFGGVDEIMVTDGHWDGRNILIDELDERAHLQVGNEKRLAMLQGVDQGVQAVFLIGYHAKAGTQNAILDHTWSSRTIYNVELNGKSTGEIGLNALLAGHFNVPVVMVSGDQSACAEAAEWLPGVQAAVVKTATGRGTADCLAPAASHACIGRAVNEALRHLKAGSAARPLKAEPPLRLALDFFYTGMADQAALLPGSSRTGSRRIEITCADMPAVLQALRAAAVLAAH